MRITPLDIYQQEFKRVLRGIDPDEVEDFLEKVADDYEQVLKENAALKDRIESLETQLKTNGKTGQADDLDRTAREDANSIIREAKKEADNLIREAKKEADNIIRKAEANVAKTRESVVPDEQTETNASEFIEKTKMEELQLRQEISKLRGNKERFLIEYRELLEKHLKILTEDV